MFGSKGRTSSWHLSNIPSHSSFKSFNVIIPCLHACMRRILMIFFYLQTKQPYSHRTSCASMNPFPKISFPLQVLIMTTCSSSFVGWYKSIHLSSSIVFILLVWFWVNIFANWSLRICFLWTWNLGLFPLPITIVLGSWPGL